MSIAAGIRAAISSQLAQHVPDGVQVRPVHPAAEMTATKGAIWVHEFKINSEWRGLGNTAAASHNRRHETGLVTLQAICYREGLDPASAADAAIARVDEIVAGVEAAMQADNSFGGAVDSSLLQTLKSTLYPRDSGWTAGMELVLEVKHRP